MMKTKNLAILAVIIIALTAVSFMQKSSHQKSTSRSSTVTLIEGNWTVNNISRLSLGMAENDNLVSLEINPDQSWTVTSAWDAPGDVDKISNLLFSLSKLAGEFRSDNASVLPDYQLDQAQAVAVRGYGSDGEKAFEIFVGKAPMGSQGNFVRLPTDDRVFLSQKNLLSALGLYSGPRAPENKHFIKLKPLTLDKLDVNGIVLQNDGQTLELVKVFSETKPVEGDTTSTSTMDRNTWEWKLASGDAVALAKTKVDPVMNALLGINAVDVDDPFGNAEDYGLQTVTRSATVFLEDGSTRVLEFGSQRPAGIGGSSHATLPAGRWMRVEGNKSIWIVTDYTVNNIFKNVEELQAE